MKALRSVAVVVLALGVLSGCSTMTPARYSVSADTNQMLKQMRGGKAALAGLSMSVDYDPNCRLMGPIQAGDGLTVPQFIANAINGELKFADLYDAKGAKLEGEVTKVAFSSTDNLTQGWWDIGVTLRSDTGTTVNAENRYSFESGFDAITACNQTTQALGAATQDLIKKLVAQPGFAALLR